MRGPETRGRVGRAVLSAPSYLRWRTHLPPRSRRAGDSPPYLEAHALFGWSRGLSPFRTREQVVAVAGAYKPLVGGQHLGRDLLRDHKTAGRIEQDALQ